MSEHDESRIISLIGSLNRVEPPSDFDVRTKARIAAGRPTRHFSWFPASIRVAAPLALTLAVGGYFGLNYYYSVSDESVPAVAATKPVDVQPLKPTVSPTASTIVTNQFVASTINVPRRISLIKHRPAYLTSAPRHRSGILSQREPRMTRRSVRRVAFHKTALIGKTAPALTRWQRT